MYLGLVWKTYVATK